MTPLPLVLGLTLCEKAIVEEGTKNITLVSTFSRLVVDGFPSRPQRIALHTVLTGGRGDGTIDLLIRHVETNDEVLTAQMPVRFPDPVMEVRVLFRLSQCTFQDPGEYLCTLLLDGELLAQRRLEVIEKEQ